MGITNLNTHSASYVTVAELAEYWDVTRQLVYKHIQSGLLPAMRLGPRCFRVRTKDAVEFEQLLSSKWSTNGPPPPVGPRTLLVQLVRRRSTSA
jgi:excisionase family DNA binding protein